MKTSPISCAQVEDGLFPFKNESQHDYQAVCGHVTGGLDLEAFLQTVDDHEEYIFFVRGPDPDVIACYQTLINSQRVGHKYKNNKNPPWGTWPEIGGTNYRRSNKPSPPDES